MRAIVDCILERRGSEYETAPVEIEEDTVFVALLTTPTTPLPEPPERAKRHHSSRTTEGEDARARKKEQTNLEAARRASVIDEETRQMRAQ